MAVATTDDQLDAVFGALADPTRRSILARLTRGEATVAELVAPFEMSQPAISRHLKVLERAGLITRTRRATARLSHLRAKPLQDATEWLTAYREFWEERYERLDEVLAALQEHDTDRSPDPDPGSDPTGRSTS
jgi:DNA-binding transcriptional ArsR family regulator